VITPSVAHLAIDTLVTMFRNKSVIIGSALEAPVEIEISFTTNGAPVCSPYARSNRELPSGGPASVAVGSLAVMLAVYAVVVRYGHSVAVLLVALRHKRSLVPVRPRSILQLTPGPSTSTFSSTGVI